jgi:hypothetical protein
MLPVLGAVLLTNVYSLLVAHPLHCLPALGPALLAVSEDDIVSHLAALFTVLTMLTLVYSGTGVLVDVV